LGYKLIETSTYGDNGLINASSYSDLMEGTTFIFAIPWSASGLEEVPTTLKSFIISPNPAAGYISHKESIGNISKNEKYNIDISKIPSGKYLVTIVNGKTYTTPQKLIVL